MKRRDRAVVPIVNGILRIFASREYRERLHRVIVNGLAAVEQPQRYTCNPMNDNAPAMRPDPKGEWVRWSDCSWQWRYADPLDTRP